MGFISGRRAYGGGAPKGPVLGTAVEAVTAVGAGAMGQSQQSL